MIYSYSEKGYQIQNVVHKCWIICAIEEYGIIGAHFNEPNKLFLISIS